MASIGVTATPSGPPPRRRQRPRTAIELAQALIASAFELLSRLRQGHKLGPDLGYVSQRLDRLDLSHACPHEYPPAELIEPDVLDAALKGAWSEELRRVTAWAITLESHLGRIVLGKAPTPVVTTCGLAWVDGEVRLCVIRYERLRTAVRVRRLRDVVLHDYGFPVITRPWLERHDGLAANSVSGSCWVTLNEDGHARHGLLTARHAVLPEEAPIGANVRLDLPGPPSPGQLLRASSRMDAAVVEVSAQEWRGREEVIPSATVGLKPVRLIGSSGTVDGDIIEFSGVAFGVIPAQAGVEPETPVQFILNCRLRKGDSGCVGIDLEPEQYGAEAPPYLLYLGVKNLGFGGVPGYGQMLEQVRRVWNLNFYR